MNDNGVEKTKNIYLGSLTKYVNELRNELNSVNKSITRSRVFTNRLENRKAELTLEIENTLAKINNIQNSKNLEEMGIDTELTEHYSEKLGENSEEIEETKEKIDELKKDLETVDNVQDKVIIENKIVLLERELKKLKKKDIKFSNRQRSLVIKKDKLNRLRERGFRKQTEKVIKAEMKAEKNQDKIDNSKSDGVVSNALNAVREVKASYYKKKAFKAREVLNNMDGHSWIKGARAIAVAKTYTDKLRNNLSKDDVQSMLPMTVDNTAQATKTM